MIATSFTKFSVDLKKTYSTFNDKIKYVSNFLSNESHM